MINLNEIILPLRFVDDKPDTTDRNVSLAKILKMPAAIRQYLFFIDDFQPTIKNYIDMAFIPELDKDVIKVTTIETECTYKGYIHFWFNDNLCNYRCWLEYTDRKLFENIRKEYYSQAIKQKT